MKPRTLLCLAFVGLLLIPVAAGAQGFGPGHGDGFGPRHPDGMGEGTGFGFLRMLLPPPGYLDLTDEQKDAVEALVDDTKAKLEPVHDQMQTIREELQTELDKDSPSAQVVGQLVIDGKGLRETVRSELEAFETAFVALLTPEQATAYENYKELRESRHGRRHGGRGGFGPGPGPGGFGG